jgi:hypothetical protein
MIFHVPLPFLDQLTTISVSEIMWSRMREISIKINCEESGDWSWRNRGITPILVLEAGGRNQISLSQNSQGTSRYSNQVLPEYKSKTLPLRQPLQRSCEICGFNSGGGNDRKLLRHAVWTLRKSLASSSTWTWMHFAPPKLQLFTSLYSVTYQKFWLLISTAIQ